MIRCLTLLGLIAVLVTPALGSEVFKATTTGNPMVQSVDVIAFGPEGALLIGDGKGAQVVAVDTGDTTAKPWTTAAIDKLDQKLASRIGEPAKGIEIVNMAVNPASGTAYLVARRRSDQKTVIFTVDGSGKIGELPLEDVKHVRMALPKGEKAPPNKVTDLAWAGDRILVAAAANEQFLSKVYSIPAPLDVAAGASIYSTDTYHVSHHRWETKAPISTLMPYEEDGKKYVVGAFACTPVVKYPLDDLKSGSHVKGVSVVELGNGNKPLHMFTYEKDGKSYVLMNTFRMQHKRKAFGPSPYWTAKMELSLLGEKEKVNENAQLRIDNQYRPVTDRIQLVEAYHGVVHMGKLDKEKALVIKDDGKEGHSLTVLALP